MSDKSYDYQRPTDDTIKLPLCRPVDMPDSGVSRERFPDRFDRALVCITPQLEDSPGPISGSPIEFDVPIEDVFDLEGPVAEPPGGLVPDWCEASDQLREHDQAPQEARNCPAHRVKIPWLFDSDAVSGHPARHEESST